MRLRWGVVATGWLVTLGLGLAVPARARAQHVETRAAVTLTAAYTRSLGDAASIGVLDANTFSSVSLVLSPSLIALLDTPRTENTLTYAFSLTAPFYLQAPATGPQNPIVPSNRFSYAGHYELSEITSMTFGVNFLESPINTLVPSQAATATPVQTEPAGVAQLITVSGNEGFSRQITERMAFTQAGAFSFGDPIDPLVTRARTYSAQNSFGIGRTFAYDLLGVTLTNQLNYFTAAENTAGGLVTPATSTYINTLALNWTRPFSDRLTSALTAGVTQTLSPDALQPMQVQPTGSVTLNYTFNYATAALAYAHAAMPNLATATVDFNDAASLRFSVPIGVTGLIATGTFGFTHSVPIATSSIPVAGIVNGPVNVYVGDATLDYHPERWPTLTVGLRGQLTRQAPLDDPTLATTFTRYSLALNLTYSYPNANAAAVRPPLAPLLATAPPSSDVVSTDRFFSAGDQPPVEEAPPAP
jgi:hypothetical protein